MEFGMPTLVELAGAERNAALCAELGLRFVELNMNLPEYADVAGIDRALLRSLAEKHGVYFTLHLDERMDVCDFNPLVRAAYLETLRRALELAGELHMPILNLHFSSGVYFTLPDRKVWLYERQSGAFEEALDEFRALVDAHCPRGTRVCIENTDGFPAFARRGIEGLLDSPNFGLTLDVGHMHAIGDADAPFYAAHMERLAHMHLHDAAGRKNHLPLGAGDLDWREKIALAEAHGARAVVEVKTPDALRSSVEALAAR
ncbi:MAG: sugar phosphate isomerase/epimerase family protein [Candidatus Spyradocola sp.]